MRYFINCHIDKIYLAILIVYILDAIGLTLSVGYLLGLDWLEGVGNHMKLYSISAIAATVVSILLRGMDDAY